MRSSRVISTGYRLARALRHGPDRMLHPIRRRTAIRNLHRLHVPRSALFICDGNICRSPYAERACARAVRSEWSGIAVPGGFAVRSAGFIGPGRPSPPAALEVAADHGVDLTGHRSRILTPDAIEAAGAIFVMTQPQRTALVERYSAPSARVFLLGDFDPGRIDTRAIRDPIEQSGDVFESVYDRIDRCIDTVLEASGLTRSATIAGSPGGG